MYSALVTKKTNQRGELTDIRKSEIEIHCMNPPNTRPFKGLTPIITTSAKPIIKIINGEGSKSPKCYKS